MLISLTLLIVVYGPFVLWYFDGWYRLIQHLQLLSRFCSKFYKQNKDKNKMKNSDEQTPLALRSSLDFRITKPLKLNLRRLVLTQADTSERHSKSKVGVRKFGVLPTKMY